jgi:hypothetical protein
MESGNGTPPMRHFVPMKPQRPVDFSINEIVPQCYGGARGWRKVAVEFESRQVTKAEWQGNGHLDISDMP